MNSVGKTIVGLLATAVIGGGGAYATCTTIQNNQLKGDNSNLTETVTQITNENEQLKSDRDKLEEKVLNLGVEMINKQNTIKTLEDEKTRLTIQVEDISDSLELANQNIAILNGKLTEEQNKVNKLTSEKTELETNIQTLQTNLNDTTNRLTAKTNEYNQVCQDLSTANRNITELEQRKTELEAEIQTLQTDKANLQTQLDEKTTQYNNVVRELETANQNIETLTNEKLNLEQEVVNLTAEILELHLIIEEKNTRIAELESQVDQLQDDIIVLQNRITELENGVTNRANLKIINGIFKLSEGSNSLIIQFVDNQTLNKILDVRTGTYASTDRRVVSTGCDYTINQDGLIMIDNMFFGSTPLKLLADEENDTYIFDSSFSSASSYIIEKLGDETRDINEVLAEINAELGYSDSSSTEVVCTYLLNSVVGMINSSPASWNIRFNSNGQDFTRLHIDYDLKFDDLIVSTRDMVTRVNEEYRTINFYEEPTGDLLTWLNQNATLQS